jgi:hypothetical protein
MMYEAATLTLFAESLNRMQPHTTPEKIPISLAALPFYHTIGANAFILRLFVTPTTLIILPQWNIDLVIKTLLQ